MNLEDRRRIIGEAKERLASAHATLTAVANRNIPDEDPLVYRTSTMPESARAAGAEQQKPKLDTAPIDWDARIAAAISAERKFLVRVVGEALGQSLNRERTEYRRELDDEIRSLRLELAALDESLSELRRMLAAERAIVLDLPALPMTRRAN